MKVRDVIAVIERRAPLSLAYSWDKPGLSIGDPETEVSAVLVALTVNREALEAAHEAGAEMIVSHHPLIWKPLTALRTDNAATRLCLDLAQASLACYAAHTNLDVAPGGVNDVLADRLGLLDKTPLLPAPQASRVKLVTFVPETHLSQVRDAVCRAGAGVIGDYTHCTFSAPGTGTFVPGEASKPFSGKRNRLNEERERRFETLVSKAHLSAVLDALLKAHPYEEVAYDIVSLEGSDPTVGLGICGRLPKPAPFDAFARHVCTALDTPFVRTVGAPDRPVQRVGVLGGAGGSEIPHLPQDIDVYLTGDIQYHDALATQQRGLALIDAGHAATEKWIVPVLAEYLVEQLRPVQVWTYLEPEIFGLVT